MKLTLDWLQSYVDLKGLAPEKLAGHLTMLGLEVDSVLPLYRELTPLVTGLVLSAEKHPDADKLTVCQVQIGEQVHQIVCGAPNVRPGLAVVVALPGTVLPGDVKIGKSKIRGVESAGMICSERELGLSTAHDGIMELPEGTEHGRTFIEAMGLADVLIEVDLTPNRPDCASVIGIAREVAGVLRQPLRLPVQDAAIATTSGDFTVEIKTPRLCPRYAARLVKNVTVGPSPWWLRKRLLSVGMRPINNIVDITNFVMMEYGQPLHAFDFDTLAGKKIVVRLPGKDELLFTTLDGSKRQLDPEMMMICDGDKPVAVAGVMGGENSEVSAATTSILLESACFNAVSVRRTGRKLGLSSEASYRFERGVDPEGTINALNRAVQLICDLAGGTAPDDGVDCYPGRTDRPTLQLGVNRCNMLIGISLTAREVADLLNSIGLTTVIKDDDTLIVTPPAFRVDIEREADLVEEVARLHGYDNIPVSLPKVDLSYPEQDPERLRRLSLARQMTAAGFTEAINYSFVSEKQLEMLGLSEDDQRRRVVRLLNPISEDQAVMRTTLLPGLLDNLRRNLNFQQTSLKLFEIGKVFQPMEGGAQPLESFCFCGVLCGNRHGDNSPLHYKEEMVDIFDVKGCVNFILASSGIAQDESGIRFVAPAKSMGEPFAEEGYTLDIYSGSFRIGTLGKLREEVLRRFAIKHQAYYFDLQFAPLCRMKDTEKKFSTLPIFPSVQRDIALVVPEEVACGDLLTAIVNHPDKLIERCQLFDVYRGEKIASGCKSVALSITYRSATKTLTEKNVEKSHEKILRLLTEQFGGTIRHE
jgi:phenylalanyl-tRNA synthetase beta chain